MDAFLGGVLAFLLTAGSIGFLSPVARRFYLVDSTGAHKTHDGDIPLVGGLGMYIGVGLTAVWFHRFSLIDIASGMAFAGAGIMAVIGFVDDMNGMSVRTRLLAQALAGLVVTLIGGCILSDLGRLFSSEILILGAFSIPVTVIAFTGGVNAMNMSDGLDGLAGGLALVTLLSLLVISLISGGQAQAHLAFLLALIGAVSGFLLFNYRWKRTAQARVFMGDAGSMSLGFMLTWLLIDLAQGPNRAMTPVTALWVFAVPLLDTLRLSIFRIMNGYSPFRPGRDHLHHFFLDAGLDVRTTVTILLGLQVLFSAIGIIGLYAGVSERVMFLAALFLFTAFFVSLADTEKAALRLRRLLTVSH